MKIAVKAGIVALLAALSNSSPVGALTLTGDTDRDGVVDLVKDAPGRIPWAPSHGAVFLNNNDSDQGSGTPDNADAAVNGTADLADLAILRATPLPALADTAVATVSVDGGSAAYVRLFVKSGASYTALDLTKAGNVPAAAVREGLELRIEAKAYAQPAWNGHTTVTLAVDGQQDSVQLRVAPYIMLPNSQRGTVLYVREHIGRNEAFLASLRTIVPAAGASLFVIPGGNTPYRSNAIWIQDAMEVGYTEMPGRWMNVVMPSNRNNTLDNFPKDRLLGADYGWFRQGTYRATYGSGDGGANSWLDWFGNLEVSPPIPGYPAGRLYYGGDGFTNAQAVLDPAITDMLKAQEIQGPPVRFDTGWLLIRHVDEMIAFIPSGNPARPWKVMVPDTGVAIQLLRDMKTAGQGSTTLLEIYYPGTTVASLVDNTALVTYNQNIQQRIEANIDLLKREFDVRDSELIRVPYLMTTGGEVMIPDMVNAVVLNGHLLMSDPNGPKVNGKDMFQRHMNDKLASTGLVTHYLDDRQYHLWSGNTHCGTNVRRDPFPRKWWDMLGEKQAAAAPKFDTMMIK